MKSSVLIFEVTERGKCDIVTHIGKENDAGGTNKMKKWMIMMFLFVMALGLCACGSASETTAAPETAQVDPAEVVEDVPEEKEEEKEDLRAPYIGSWINLYAGFQPGLPAENVELLTDGTCTVDGKETGSWSVSEDGETVMIGNWIWGFTPVEEDGFLKLMDNYTNKEGELPITSAVLVRAEDFEKIRGSMFTEIKVNAENIAEYVGELRELAAEQNEYGKNVRAFYQFLSPAYENGLVFVAADDDFSFSAYIEPNNEWRRLMTFDYPYALLTEYRQMNFKYFTEAEGTLLYVKSEYVADNRIDENGCRTLTMRDGSRITDWLTEATWSVCPADYADSRY